MEVYLKDGYLIYGIYNLPPSSCVIQWDKSRSNTPTKFKLKYIVSDKIILTESFINITDCEKEIGVKYTDYNDFIDTTSGIGSFFLKAPSGVAADALGAYGFVVDELGKTDRTTSYLGINSSTYTFSITPIGSFSYYYNSIKKTHNAEQSVVFDDTLEGKHYFYFDETFTLKTTHTFSDSLILKQVLVASIYWNATLKDTIGDIFDERHGHLQDGETHLQLHKTLRTRYDSGLSINSFVIGNGSLNSHAQFIVGAGKIHDEDLDHNIPQSSNTIGILYSLGVPTTIRNLKNIGFAIATTGTGRLAYNKISDYSLAEVSEGYFVAYHIFAMPGSAENVGQLFSIMGQAQYATLELAIEGAKIEVGLIRTSYLVSNEMKDIGSIILQTSSSYINAVKAKIVDVNTNVHYLDWRRDAAIPGNLSASEHDSSNPKLAASGVQFGHVDDIAQTFVGPKTFTDLMSVQTILFDTTYDITTLALGQIAYNKRSKTLSIGTSIPGSTDEIGGELVLNAYNRTGSQINNGQVVYISGAYSNTYNHPTVNLAIANTEENAFKSIAIATNDVPFGEIGRFTIHGEVGGLNTSAYSQGDIVYLSPTVAGGITKIKPAFPQGIVVLGVVVFIHTTDGAIFVNIDKMVDITANIESFAYVPNTRKVNGHTLDADVTVTKTDLNIENVDNTSDANKPISNATVTALNGKINTYTSKIAKYFLAAPNVGNGLPDFRAIVASDIPILNQATTANAGTATKLAATKNINSVAFDGSADITIVDATKEPIITGSGNTTDFWSGAKTFRNLATDVRSIVLTGLSLATNQAITATDSLLVSLGYLQAQITNLLNTKRTYNRVTFSNADANVASTTRYLGQIGTLTLPRVVNLPAANSLASGEEIIITDESGTVTTTNTLTITKAGSDTINGLTTEVLNGAYSWRRFISNGVNGWVFDGGIERISKDSTIIGSRIYNASSTFANSTIFTKIVSPATLTGTVSNYDPGFPCNTVRQDATANRIVTGFLAQVDGYEFTFINISESNITLNHLATSITANQIIGANDANVTIRKGGSVILRYDGISTKWRIIAAAL